MNENVFDQDASIIAAVIDLEKAEKVEEQQEQPAKDNLTTPLSECFIHGSPVQMLVKYCGMKPKEDGSGDEEFPGVFAIVDHKVVPLPVMGAQFTAVTLEAVSRIKNASKYVPEFNALSAQMSELAVREGLTDDQRSELMLAKRDESIALQGQLMNDTEFHDEMSKFTGYSEETIKLVKQFFPEVYSIDLDIENLPFASVVPGKVFVGDLPTGALTIEDHNKLLLNLILRAYVDDMAAVQIKHTGNFFMFERDLIAADPFYILHTSLETLKNYCGELGLETIDDDADFGEFIDINGARLMQENKLPEYCTVAMLVQSIMSVAEYAFDTLNSEAKVISKENIELGIKQLNEQVKTTNPNHNFEFGALFETISEQEEVSVYVCSKGFGRVYF
jgi:hypothetical protein